jgi:hypothetical protein
MKRFYSFLAVLITLLIAVSSFADSRTAMHVIKSGFNVYAPFTLYDGGSPYAFKHYYSGELTTAPIQDNIYLAYSNDVVTWVNDQELFDGTALAGIAPNPANYTPDGVRHVGDPTVVKYGSTYYMTYTVQRYCDVYQKYHGGEGVWMQHNQEIWGAFSSNGVNWYGHKPILYSRNYLSNPAGPSEPDLHLASSFGISGCTFVMYYEDRRCSHRVQMAKLDINLNATSIIDVANVYGGGDPGQATNPSVAKSVTSSGTHYELFFNAGDGGLSDIWKIVSNSPTSFTGTPELIIEENTYPPHCDIPDGFPPGVYTPWVAFPNTDGTYLLYFGQYQCGDTGQEIMMWEMAD